MSKGLGTGRTLLRVVWPTNLSAQTSLLVMGLLITALIIVCLPASALGEEQAVAGEEQTAVAVSAEIGEMVLAQALRFVDLEFEANGGLHQGVAYLWGGRMGVDEYVAAVQAGAQPGVDAGVDASGVVVQSIRSVLPGHKFAGAPGGAAPVVQATSATLFHFNVAEVAVDELRPGDLLFFQDSAGNVSGVGIFERRVGPNVHFIIASARAGRVIKTFYNVNNDSWKTQFKAAGRLLEYFL